MSSSEPRRRVLAPIPWLGCALAIPCVVSALTVVWGLPAVLATGMCPPAPPDIPAYPCTPWDYLARMTVGFWALAGHMTFFCSWAGLTAITWLIVRGIVGRAACSTSGVGEPGAP